jgi:two-component system CheB/CheR fusion protein
VTKRQSKSIPKPRRKTPAVANNGPRLVVGIGASAGGLEAFRTFFANMPADSGMAFVLVQHLSPQHESMLAKLLSAGTAMPVVEATDRLKLAADHVYVIPPNATLRIGGGQLLVSRPAPPREHRYPVDTLFSTLAKDQKEKAVCIILSGGGSDGTEGVKLIKEHGGLAMAQAEFDHQAMNGMPFNAAATGLVDHVMPVAEMPAKLIAHAGHLHAVAPRKTAEGTLADAEEHLSMICSLLRGAVGHDFSHYKDQTLVRRIQRRMQILQVDSTPAYIERLRKDPHEINRLFRDLLIGVTAFFRDPEAFEALAAQALASLLDGKDADDTVRVWVPACATGQEAYSIAVVLKEAAEKLGVRPSFQLFATDIDEHAVKVARSARYPKAQFAEVPAARVARWFAADGDHFCPVKEIREMCIFSTHSVVKDPPFSRLDLISCRNLMIYLDATLQDRLLRTFHYALRPGGSLFLGTSENVTRHGKLFTVLDAKHRVFKRRDALASLPAFPSRPVAPDGTASAGRSTPLAESRLEKASRRVVDKHVPAYVVVDGNQDVVRFSGEIDRYLGPSPGAASLGFFTLIRRSLRSAARAALSKAIATGQPVTQDAVPIEVEGRRSFVDLIVEPVPDSDEGLCVVVFVERKPVPGRAPAEDERTHTSDTERELLATRERLEATVEQLEISNEEAKSANEEYQSVNEELQSANEELETSKEEMQSINEELQTVNAELNSKSETLQRLNSDLKNLLDSTQIATLFLDRQLLITGFTPPMAALFHVRDTDQGRPVGDIVSRLSYDALEADAAQVLRDLSMVEREVSLKHGGNSFLMRLRPYRTVDNVVDGVVITFVDVTERRKADDIRSHLIDELNHRVKNTLATVQSIVAQSLKGSVSAEDRDKLDARLTSLARTHNLLARESWAQISLRQLLLQEFEPYQVEQDGRFVADGPDIDLSSGAGLTLGLAFHELATNAAKYGALSTPAGQLRVTWTITGSEEAQVLRLEWAERGGPPVKPPTRKGFGSALIQRGVEYALDGTVDIDFRPDGLVLQLEIPISSLAAGQDDSHHVGQA